MSGATDRYDVVVIGGGQAGLAIGYYLAQQGVRFLILEREHDVASAWRDRWDSLTLFTPRAYDSLPGLEFPGDPDGYPTRVEVLDYLQRYAANFDLPVRLGTQAKRLSGEAGQFVIELADGDIAADQVVIATGPFQEPRVPAIADGLAAEVVQMRIRSPTSWRRLARPTSPSARVSQRCRSGSSVATCSSSSARPASSTNRSTRGSAGV